MFLLERWQGSSCVELARLLFLLTQGLRLRNFLFGSHGFLFERRQRENLVDFVRHVFLFRVGLAQLFVGVALSESGDQGKCLVGLGRKMLWFDVELTQLASLGGSPTHLVSSVTFLPSHCRSPPPAEPF